jgi:hypothetical protein
MGKIRYCKIVGFVIAIVFILGILPGIVTAHEDSLHVILTSKDSDRGLTSGDTATVSVHVFDKGKYVNADQNPTLSIEGEDIDREIETDKVNTGQYKGSISIMDSDIDNTDYLWIELVDIEEGDGYYYYYDEYAVSNGKDDDSDTTYNYITSYETNDVYLYLESDEETGIEIDLEITDYTDYPFEPGDEINFVAKVTEDGQLVEPDDIELEIYYYDKENYDYQEDPLSYNNPSTGIYEAFYKIPNRMNTATQFTVYARAKLDDSSDDWDDYDYVSFELYFFEIWYHEGSQTDNKVNFEIWVADVNGVAVSSAEVCVEYEYYKDYGYEDTDWDDFSDKYEEYIGTDPDDYNDYPFSYRDSDYDGFGDNFEIKCGTDPDNWWDYPDYYNDTDWDGFTDEEEEYYGSDPDDIFDYPEDEYSKDTDDDYVGDLEEQFYGTDPEDRYDHPRYSRYITESEKKKTDFKGKTSFSIDKPNEDLDIDGYVTKGDYNQSFDGEIEIEEEDEEPGEPEPYGYGFELFLDDDIDYLTAGEGKKSLRYLAFLDGEKLENGDIYYYVYNEKEVLSYGKATTTATGKFTISVAVPDESDLLRLQFETAVGNHPIPFQDYGWEDSDWDDFSDKFENYLGTDPYDRYDYPTSYMDSDNDDFTDEFEEYIGTDPNDYYDYPCGYQDSDWDDFGDEFENYKGTDPYDWDDYPQDYKDSDYDGFGDLYETNMGTDPEDGYDYPSDYEDSDGDDFGDDYEIACGTNPNSYYDYPTDYPDNTNDTDWDGHYDGEENYYGTDPNDYYDYPRNTYSIDSDYDSHPDAEESFYGTNPNDSSDYPYDSYSIDSDYDDHPDVEESYYGTDPNDYYDYPEDTYDEDSDWDGFCDPEEIYYGTDPDDWDDYPEDEYQIDSDWDDVCDLEEEYYGTDPYDSSSSPAYEPDPWDPDYTEHNSIDGKLYEMESDMMYVREDSDELYTDDEVDVTVDTLETGGKTKVTVTPSSKPVAGVSAVWFMGTMDDYVDDISDRSWQNWGESGGSVLLTKEGSNYVGYIIIPDFLPGGVNQKYTVAGSYFDEKTGDYYVNHVTLTEGESKSTISEDDEPFNLFEEDVFGIPMLYLIILIIIIIMIIIIAAVARKRAKRKRKKVPPPRPQVQGPPPQQYQPQVQAAGPGPQPRVQQGYYGQPPPTPPPQQPAVRPTTPQAQQPYQPPGQRPVGQQQQYYQPAAGQPQAPQYQQPPPPPSPESPPYGQPPQQYGPPPGQYGYGPGQQQGQTQGQLSSTQTRPNCAKCGTIMTADDAGNFWCPNCGYTERPQYF